jgi:hypothetical protein
MLREYHDVWANGASCSGRTQRKDGRYAALRLLNAIVFPNIKFASGCWK